MVNWVALEVFVVARLREASTWRGVVLVITALGGALNPTQAEAIVLAGMAIAGMVGVLLPDQKA